MSATPDVSVVIPSLAREPRLAFALDALAAQTLPPERFEVMVVRGEGVEGPLTSAPEGLRVRFLEGPRESAAAKRNLGWRAARAPLIAFTDDDCRPAPDWLESLLAAAKPDAIVQGRTESDPDELHLLDGVARTQRIAGPSAWYETCNIAYGRALLERVRGFDERYAIGGEDTDLGLRARAAGARLVYEPGAVVMHAVSIRSFPGALTKAGPFPTQPLVVARHPELREALYLGLFWRRAHARLVLSLALLALAGRRRLAPAAMLPYVWPELRYGLSGAEATPRGVLRLALSIGWRGAVDLAGLARSARLAIRHRTLVL
ncbi:MAG: glycosyltransferase family 2 protein [Solirubrobacterales bacterium]